MISRKVLFHFTLWTLFAVIAVYTRFVGLDWGLPHPMHPDERNMVTAILGMTCHQGWTLDCLNPHFYAYGQLPLFLGYDLAMIMSLMSRLPTLDFVTVTLALRALSATASLATVFLLVKCIDELWGGSRKNRSIAFFAFVFSPVMIQFAHFGTTESLLMFFITLMVYLALRYLNHHISIVRFVFLEGIIFGLAVSTKVSSVPFALVPVLALAFVAFSRGIHTWGEDFFAPLVKIAALSVVVFIITSPYNLLDWEAFVHSLNYESSVGLGTYKAFYTRQFEYTLPVLFQLKHIFPYALGWPMFIVSLVGFVFLPWKKSFLMMRILTLALFLPNAWLYAKWSRFYAPVYPLLLLFGVSTILFVLSQLRTVRLFDTKSVWVTVSIISIILVSVHGYAYLSIYTHPDVRFEASRWILENIPARAKILSETANVVDIPTESTLTSREALIESDLHPISFDFYEVDSNEILESDLKEHIDSSDYIFVPSRRVFTNHTCVLPSGKYTNVDTLPSGFSDERCDELSRDYPLLTAYYEDLFSGRLGFTQVAEIHAYPRITLFGRTLLSFPDEDAEETWTVFDHPVVRIYERKN